MPREAISAPRLLVVACYPPEGGGGGGVILRSLIKDYPSERLMWVALRPDRTKRRKWYRPQVLRWSFPIYLPATVSRLMGPMVARLIVGMLDWMAVCLTQIAILRHKPTDVLLVVDHNSIHAASRLAQNNSTLRFHLTVHDDPLVTSRMCDTVINSYKISEKFASLCRIAVSIDCVSERMAQKYHNQFKVSPLVLPRCAEDSYLAEIALKPIQQTQDGIKLIQSGWGDCPPPWPSNLIEALLIISKDIKVEFHVFDPKFLQCQEHDWIMYHKPIAEPEFDALLSKMDASYAPDPLTEIGRQFASMSLSTKIVTSICAGLPFVYHGPEDSTVGDLLRQEPLLGVIVESQAPEKIAQAIMALLVDYPLRVTACRNFAQRNYSASRLRQRFLSRFEQQG